MLSNNNGQIGCDTLGVLAMKRWQHHPEASPRFSPTPGQTEAIGGGFLPRLYQLQRNEI